MYVPIRCALRMQWRPVVPVASVPALPPLPPTAACLARRPCSRLPPLAALPSWAFLRQLTPPRRRQRGRLPRSARGSVASSCARTQPARSLHSAGTGQTRSGTCTSVSVQQSQTNPSRTNPSRTNQPKAGRVRQEPSVRLCACISLLSLCLSIYLSVCVFSV